MKRFIAMLLASALLLGCALAEPSETDYSEAAGMPSRYRVYDLEEFGTQMDPPGQIVRFNYTTDLYGEPGQRRWANVYLPSGYDEAGSERYNIIYFLHGYESDQTALLGTNMETRNAFDHMIASGVAEPFIIVAPTYYYNPRKRLVDFDLFTQELFTDLMPAIESTYRTYAETPDDAGFEASRDHRAFCGFSRGSMTTWMLFDRLLKYSRYFIPCSGAYDDFEHVYKLIDEKAPYADDFFIYMACGGPEDEASEGCIAMAQKLYADTEHFHYGTGEGDNFYFCLSDNRHQCFSTRYYIYNALLDVLFK